MKNKTKCVDIACNISWLLSNTREMRIWSFYHVLLDCCLFVR